MEESAKRDQRPSLSSSNGDPASPDQLIPPIILSTIPPKPNTGTDTLQRGFRSSKNQKYWDIAGLITLAVVIAVVWCTYSVPIILYHVKRHQTPDSIGMGGTEMFEGTETCEPYTMESCSSVLQQIRQCLLPTNREAEIMVSPRGGDLDMAEMGAESFSTLLRVFGASQQCAEAAIPFGCLYLFPLCDSSSGELVYPTAEECMHLSDDVCATVWAGALQNPAIAARLPDCDLLPVANSSAPSCMLSENVSVSSNTTCRDEFLLVNGACIARCDSWEQDPHDVSLALDLIELVGALFGLLGTIMLVVISIIRWRSMFSFPAVLIVYMTISFSIFTIFALMTYVARDKLYCETPETSVSSAVNNPTPFCTINGAVLQFVIFNTALLWSFHVSVVFWSLMLPVHYRRHRRYQMYIHIALVAASILIPIPGIIAGLVGEGYAPNKFPPLLCGSYNADVMYYSCLFPVNIIIAIGLAMITTMFWKVHKDQGMFQLKKTKNPFQATTAEKKLLFVFIYYAIFVAVLLIHFALFTGDRDNLKNAATAYFVCEASGHDPENPCPKDYEKYSHPGAAAATFVLIGFLPLVNLIYVIPWRGLYSKIRRLRRRTFTLSSVISSDNK